MSASLELTSQSCPQSVPRKVHQLSKTLPPHCLLKVLPHQLLPGLLDNRRCFCAEELHVLNQLNKPGNRADGVCHTSLKSSNAWSSFLRKKKPYHLGQSAWPVALKEKSQMFLTWGKKEYKMFSLVSCHLFLEGNRHKKSHIEIRQILLMFSNTLNFPEEP